MLQTSRFQVSRKKWQVISIALKFARFVVLEINSLKHNIHVLDIPSSFKWAMCRLGFSDLKKRKKKKKAILLILLTADVEGTDRGYPVYDTDSGYRSTWFIRRLLLSLIGQLVWWVSLHTSRIRPKYQIWQNICANQRPCRYVFSRSLHYNYYNRLTFCTVLLGQGIKIHGYIYYMMRKHVS